MFRHSRADSPSLQAGVMGFCSGGITAGFFPLMEKKKPKHAALSLGDDKGTLGLQMFGTDDRWRRRSRGSDGSGVYARLLPPPRTPAQVFFFVVSLRGAQARSPPNLYPLLEWQIALTDGEKTPLNERVKHAVTQRPCGHSLERRHMSRGLPPRPHPLGQCSPRRVKLAGARRSECLKVERFSQL